MYSRICSEHDFTTVIKFMKEIKLILEEFDAKWVKYEKLYVIELMLIE